MAPLLEFSSAYLPYKHEMGRALSVFLGADVDIAGYLYTKYRKVQREDKMKYKQNNVGARWTYFHYKYIHSSSTFRRI